MEAIINIIVWDLNCLKKSPLFSFLLFFLVMPQI